MFNLVRENPKWKSKEETNFSTSPVIKASIFGHSVLVASIFQFPLNLWLNLPMVAQEFVKPKVSETFMY
jgi:hypothetical protein